jgi:hypothetical protein
MSLMDRGAALFDYIVFFLKLGLLDANKGHFSTHNLNCLAVSLNRSPFSSYVVMVVDR